MEDKDKALLNKAISICQEVSVKLDSLYEKHCKVTDN